MNTKLLP